MKVLRAIFVVAFCLTVPPLAAGSLVDDGFQHYYNLEYDEALADFDQAIARQPDNPDLHNYAAAAILFREMYRDGALESELVTGNNSWLRKAKLNPTAETEKRFDGEMQRALDIEQARLRRNGNDTGALYSMGITYGLRGNWLFLVKRDWRAGLSDATTARKLHLKVTELDPGNVDARLVQGVYDYIVGSLPPFYKMVGFLIGFHGDKERGIRTIETVAEHGKLNRVDAQIFLATIYRREHQPAKALPVVESLMQRYPRNFFLRFAEAGLYASLGDKRAIGSIEEVARLKASGAPGYSRVPWETIDYHLGTIQFWSNDLTDALANMQKVTAHPDDVDLNTGVLAWMRVGQIYDLENRHNLAVEAYRKAMAYAPDADAASESRHYISSPYHRQKS